MKKVIFNDGWTYGEDKTPVIIPHDGMLYSERDPNSINGRAKGFFDGGIYTYNKSFFVPIKWKDKHIELQFEGGI